MRIARARTRRARSRPKLIIRLIGFIAILLALQVGGQAFASDSTNISIVDSARARGAGSSMVLDSQGFPVISYFHYTETERSVALRVARCNDVNCDSAEITTIDTDLGTLEQTSDLALDSADNPVIVYSEYRDQANHRVKLARCFDTSCTSTTIRTVARLALWPSMALDSAGYPVISFSSTSDDGQRRLKLAHCRNVSCGSADIETVDDRSGRASSLVLDSAGFPVIGYDATERGSVRLAHCNDANCATASVETIEAVVGQYPSLQLDSSGYPVLAYRKFRGSDVKLARCSDSTCTAVNVEKVDGRGIHVSMVLDSDDYPVISHYDPEDHDLQLVRCTDANCTTSRKRIVDSFGLTGIGPSVALDDLGHPIISYGNNWDSELRVAHCANPYCASMQAEPPADGTYYLQSVETGRFLDADPDGSVGTSATPKSDDRWNITLFGERQWHDMYDVSNADYPTFIDRGRWRIEPIADGTFYLRRLAKERSLSTNGADVVVEGRVESDRWVLVPA